MVSIGDLDRHLVADRAAGLDDRRHAGLGGHLDAVREREVRVAGHHRQPRPVARATQRDLDRHLPARLPGPDPDGRRVLRQHDRVRADVAHGAPGEQQVRQLLERRAALRDDLELVAVDAQVVDRLDEQSAADALEVELGDAVVAHALDGIGRDERAAPGSASGEGSRSPNRRSRARSPPRTSSPRSRAPSRRRASGSRRRSRRTTRPGRSRARGGRPRRARPTKPARRGRVCLAITTVGVA